MSGVLSGAGAALCDGMGTPRGFSIGVALLAQLVAVPRDSDHLIVVQESVENRGRGHVVNEYGTADHQSPVRGQ